VLRRRLALLCLVLAAPLLAADNALLPFSADEVNQIVAHGPWPPQSALDTSNRVSGNAAAIDLGGRLFFDPRLSRDGSRACASCHVPERSFTDGQPRAIGLAPGDRNTPTLMNPRLQRWYGHDGAADSLWAQSIAPMLNPRELGSSPQAVAAVPRKDADFACRYEKAFGARVQAGNDEEVMVNMAKALAAFQETLVSGRTPFDDFRDALARGDRVEASKYPLAAQRGLKIFIGKGNCAICHVGPNFTHGEFADIGVPFFLPRGGADAGRHEGIRKLKASRFNLLGPYNDDATRENATSTRHVTLEHRNFGEFKVPVLRNLKFTAPYMHNGSMATLAEVVKHYSEVSEDRLHADGTNIVKALNLTAREQADMVAFLESLSTDAPQWRSRNPKEGPACVPGAPR
jgi:cytochrome c peroxidase